MNRKLRIAKPVTSTLLAVLLGLFSINVSAHHPVVSQYNIERQYTIEGILKRVEIGSPHSFFHILHVDENGDEGIVKVEWGSASTLLKLHSINRSTIRLEQRIRVRGYMSINREDFMMWPMLIHTEYDIFYDRINCNTLTKSGRRCEVLTSNPPLWPLLPSQENP